MTDQQSFQDQDEVLKHCAALLGEHFSAALILVCVPKGVAGTGMTARIRGDYYAAKGMAHAWLEDEQSRTTASELGKRINPDDL